MADDDLPTRLHWPADPLDGGLGGRGDAPATPPAPPGGPAAPAAPGAPERATRDEPARSGDRDDIAALRAEIAELRHAFDDLADRVQLRQVRAAIDELRTEVLALRRVVVEWPELDQLTTEVGSLRSHLLDLQQRPPAAPADPAVVEAIAELRATIDGLGPARTQVTALGPIVEELGELREEFVALRRRISLRGQPTDATLDEAQLDRIVESVVERVLAGAPPSPARRRR
jgi:hypothetical protein